MNRNYLKMTDIKQKIRGLVADRRAVVLAHNYQPPEIQELADLCGDSLELSIKASQTDAEVIVFCGVHFMAETASIISPQKTVLLPRHDAGCPMADMVDPDSLAAKLAKLTPMPVVTYVNSTAAVKALSTICCTSANVVRVVNSLPEDEILMTPDRNLALYAASQTNKKIQIWEGYCPTHDRLTPGDVKTAREASGGRFYRPSRVPAGGVGAGRCRCEHVRNAAFRAGIEPWGVYRWNRIRFVVSHEKGQSRQSILPGLGKNGVPEHEEDFAG